MTEQEDFDSAPREVDSRPQDLDAERTSAPFGSAIALLMMAIMFGGASLIFVVFGAWPAVILVAASALTGWLALRKIRKQKPATMP